MPLKTTRKLYFHITASLILLGVLCLYSNHAVAQLTSDQRYNRFQYHKDSWKAFHTTAFHVYFTQCSDSLCSFIVKELPEAIKRVKRNMGTTLLKAPNIVIYPSPDQLYESNIGMYEIESNTLPTFISKGTRLVLAYSGDYDDLKWQLYEALAREIWDVQFKEGLAQQAKGLLGNEDIPMWYREGSIRYFANQWPIAAEDELRRSYEEQQFQNWQQCIAYQPRLGGQAFCYFLTQQYYPLAAMQLFTQLKKKKSLVRALRLITKRPIDTVYKQCNDYYRLRFIRGDNTDTANANYQFNKTTIHHKKGIVKNAQITASGNDIAYVVSRNNIRTVYLYKKQSNQTGKLTTYRLPPWINDYSRDIYPLIKWNKEGNELSIISPSKGKTTIHSYALTGAHLGNNSINGADGVTGLTQTSKAEYLLSPYRKGESDIVAYNYQKEEYKIFTNDAYDDGQAVMAYKPSDGIFFISKRKEQEPTPEQKRTFGFKDTSKRKQGIYFIQNQIVQPIIVDSIPYVRWDKPVLLANGQLLATNTKYGSERFALINNPKQTSPTDKQLSNYQPTQYLERTNEVSYYRQTQDSITVTTEPIDQWIKRGNKEETASPWLIDYNNAALLRAKEDSILKAARDETPSFLEGVLVPKDANEQSNKRADSIARSEAYDPKKVRTYVLQLHSAYFTAKVNNDYLINRYQPYKGYQGQFKFPELGGMAQGGFTDLLENHHVNIAFRLPAATEGSDFFIRYENTAKKLDWGISYFRKVESLRPDPLRNWTDETGKQYPNIAKVKTHYAEVTTHYPLSYYLSANFTEGIRYDRTIFIATDKYSLNFEDIRSTWSITTFSLNYNKLIPTLPLLSKGYKAKATTDVFYPLKGDDGIVTGSTFQLQYHLPIYKYITLVSQLQAGYSGGQNKVLYNLGGMDNNVTVRVDSNIRAPQNAPYAFQTLVTPLRGHLQNTIKGDQYLLLNTDVYFPLFQTLIPLETPLHSINLLQPGLFIDAATVKESWNTANLNNGKWFWSYGVSARTNLAGYPIRVDVAWPGTFNKKPVWCFSLSLK